MKIKHFLFYSSAPLLLFFMVGCSNSNTTTDKVNATEIVAEGNPEVAEVTGAPLVPAPIGDRAAKKLIVNLVTSEIEGIIADSIPYTFWTFNNTVPGSFIRVRIGDEVTINLKNDANSVLPHNIDLHAVTGPGGGAAASSSAPGQTTSFTFKAIIKIEPNLLKSRPVTNPKIAITPNVAPVIKKVDAIDAEV